MEIFSIPPGMANSLGKVEWLPHLTPGYIYFKEIHFSIPGVTHRPANFASFLPLCLEEIILNISNVLLWILEIF